MREAGPGFVPESVRLSLVVPCYNEEQRLPKSVAAIEDYLDRRDGVELVLVDDGSNDESRAFMERCESERIRCIGYAENRGKGHAVKTGMLAARGQWRLFMDLDLSTPLEEVDRFMTLAGGKGVWIGSRVHPDADVVQPRHRVWMRWTFSVLATGMFGIPYADTLCGFKLFDAESAERLFAPLVTEGFSFDVEVLSRARMLGIEIHEVGVRWVNDPRSKVDLRIHPWKMLKELRAWRRRLRGRRI